MYRFWFIFVLFFVSGASGLIYQVVWSRMMALTFGRSVLAVGIVLAVFMAGLALGGYLLGKVSDKSKNPLRLYAIYELGIGFTALIASFLLMRMAPFYVWLHSTFGDSSLALTTARFLIAFLILIVPTLLMGATLPILSRVVIRRLELVGHELGKLYAINTLGAVAGTIAAGFFLISRFGLYGAIYIAVAGNLAVGLLAWIASTRHGLSEVESIDHPPEETVSVVCSDDNLSRPVSILLLFIFAMSGLASFSYEIFWTRSLVFILGNTTYAFTLMLTAFLSGIALGGYGIRFVADKVKSRLQLFAIIEIMIGLLSAASLPLLFYILESESIQSFVSSMSSQLGFLVLSESLVALIIMLLPATLIGATLPLMGRIFVSDLRHTGTTVGKVYAVNTLGNVVGALLPGLLILPLMGIQRGILLMACLNVCLGSMILIWRWKKSMVLAIAPAGVFLLFPILLVDMPISFQFPAATQTSKDAVLFYEEGGLVTTKVWSVANSGKKIISVDGVNIGGTNDVDYKQQILAHLPKLLLKSYQSELSIGLGSGILIGESAQHQQLQKIVCAEISPSVVRGAGYFTKENHDILNNARAEIVVDDIGHFLQTTQGKYDIISADGKTDEKYSSNAFSYSQNYYKLLRQHLAPGGLVIQWIPTALPSSQYNLVLRTFLDSFPHVTHWYFPPVGRFTMSNTFLIGSNKPVDIDPGWVEQALTADPFAFHGIRKYGLKTAEDVLAHFIAGEETLRRMVSKGPINSVERPYYEFYSPSDYSGELRDRALGNHALFMSIRGQDFEQFILKELPVQERNRLQTAFRAEGIFLQGHGSQLRNEPYTIALKNFNQAVNLAPWSEVLRSQIVAYLNERFRTYYSRGDYTNALAFLRLAVDIYPETAEVHEDYGMMLRLTDQTEAAVLELQRALELNPDLVFARRTLGDVYASRGESSIALEHWRKALYSDPDDIGTLATLGVHLAQDGLVSEGKNYLQKAYRLARGNPEVINGYALVLYLAGDFSSARQIVQAGGRYYEGNPSFEGIREKILDGSQ
ncbi:MAG: fused MFS/spermidine synthase [Desulfuromusa sp.]|nr:fused MFS/spermidine synthase [Desulfuromusa sp.]